MPDDPLSSPLITPDLRRRLQRQYEQALRLLGPPKPDRARAHALLVECLRADPGNILYLDALLANLRQQDRVGQVGWLRTWQRDRLVRRARAASPMALLHQAPELLAADPWHALTLVALAEACAKRSLLEGEVRYLEQALAADPNHRQALRRLGVALIKQGDLDRAHGVWKEIVARDAAETTGRALLTAFDQTAVDQNAGDALDDATPQTLVSPESSLERARLLVAAGRFDDAETILNQAQAAAGSDLRLYEARENLRLARARHRLAIAHRLAALDPSELPGEIEIGPLIAALEAEQNRLEIELYNLRAERLPTDHHVRLELARRLKRAGNFSGAIQRLEEAERLQAEDAAVLVELGECWQHLRQFEKALAYYERALAACQVLRATASGEQPPAEMHLARYRSGVLAAALGKYDLARDRLESLVAADPHFKDARQRLDNLPRN